MNTLRLICDVARLRSFSQAAVKHGITQSAASQRVNHLERKLGVTLIDRSVRPLTLTPAGEDFVHGCQDILQRYDALEEKISRLRPPHSQSTDPISGQVRIDAIYSAGIDLLNQVKESFEAQHPKASVIVEYKRPESVYEAVINSQCDLGIVSYPKRWRGVSVIPLRNERMAVVATPQHPLASRTCLQAKELASWPFLGYEPALPVEKSIKRYLRQQGVEPTITAVFDNVDTLKTAVAVTHDHVTILPKRTVIREMAAGTLAVIELEPPLVRPIGIIYRRGTLRPWPNSRHNHHAASLSAPASAPLNVVQAFVDHLLEQAGPNVDLTQIPEKDFSAPVLIGAKS